MCACKEANRKKNGVKTKWDCSSKSRQVITLHSWVCCGKLESLWECEWLFLLMDRLVWDRGAVTPYERTFAVVLAPIRSLCSTRGLGWIDSRAPATSPSWNCSCVVNMREQKPFHLWPGGWCHRCPIQEAPVFVPPAGCVSSVWRVDGVRRGCLIGLTKLKQVLERRKWLTDGQMFDRKNKR